MQQYKYLKQILQLPKLPSVRIADHNLDNADLLMVTTAILTIFNMFGIFHSLTILLLGIILPLYCIQIDISIPKHYFPVLAVFLWFRLWNSTLSSFDGCLVVGLWHTNFRLADKIVDTISKVFMPKSASVADRISKKVDRFLQ